MRFYLTFSGLLLALSLFSQNATIQGQLKNAAGEPGAYISLGLYSLADSSLVKAGISDEIGKFELIGLKAGTYFLKAGAAGFGQLRQSDIRLAESQQLDLGMLTLGNSGIQLEEATVSASRKMVETRPDRMVFNVEGTINSTGSDALTLLRKAPSVTVDNNNNISVLGRSGVLIYVDGKRLPLVGEDLAAYLQNLPAEQIDHIDIITNPGAKYEAEGNAGIIDIRLKRDKNVGANGSLNSTYSQGVYAQNYLNGTGNYRNKHFNVFANAGVGKGKGYNDMDFYSLLNGISQYETNIGHNDWHFYNYRAGVDFFLSKKQTIGLLIGGGNNIRDNLGYDRITLAQEATPDVIDSVLVAYTDGMFERRQQTYNLNYRFDNTKGRSLNIDLDYGRYENRSERFQPNRYYDAKEEVLLTEVDNSFNTPSDIDIYTFTSDYEDKLWGGVFGAGLKWSHVRSDNTFLFYDNINGIPIRNDRQSNQFTYDESVYAAYLNYSGSLGKKWKYNAGLRAEQTDADGNLKAFLPELQEPPVLFNYLSWFPTAGLTWEMSEKHTFSLSGGRRINRPDYHVLNPFNNQLSQLSYEKGNPFLRPEIVNNLEIGYTLAQRYNFKLAYSRTTDQITRLMAAAEDDPRAGFITWANLADQTIIGFNLSVPVKITKWWDAYFNLNGSHLNNQADYGDGNIVDVQAYTYDIYQQHTFSLPWKLKAEISGYYSGPGVWGGVFLYESSWSLNFGLQRKFLKDKLNVRFSANDIFYESGWSGDSNFGGLYTYGSGNWDSRRCSLSLAYRFGNDNVKSRKRSTGLESEAGRIKSE